MIRTFKGSILGQVERRPIPSQSILGIAPSRCHHLVKRSYSISNLELSDIVAHFMNNASDVVALIGDTLDPAGNLPVLGVASTHNHLDDELPGVRNLGQRNIVDGNDGAFSNECFLHGGCFSEEY